MARDSTGMAVDAPHRHRTIHKHVESLAVAPHLRDYDEACRTFSWDAAREGCVDYLDRQLA